VFGPDRAALLAADLPASAVDDQARRDRQSATLAKRLRQIDAAENAHAREIETLAHLDNPHAPAVTALRSRVLARFTELEDERSAINTQPADLAKTGTGPGDPALVDALPILGDLLAGALNPRGRSRQSAEMHVTNDAAIIDDQPHTGRRPAKVAGSPLLLHEHQGETMFLAPGFGFLDRLADHCRLAASSLKPLVRGPASGLEIRPAHGVFTLTFRSDSIEVDVPVISGK
jgi:hypothetical protein